MKIELPWLQKASSSTNKTGRFCMISIDMCTTGGNLLYSATIETIYGVGVVNNG